ncbi:MAG: hypothetical protein RCG15_01810 [Candidatus Rickettsia vulgarisii]
MGSTPKKLEEPKENIGNKDIQDNIIILSDIEENSEDNKDLSLLNNKSGFNKTVESIHNSIYRCKSPTTSNKEPNN